MPVVPPNTINDVPRAVRKELQRLFFERATLQYAFSFERLHKLFAKLQYGADYDDTSLRQAIASCIVAWKDEEAKTLKGELNDKITSLYTENGIEKTLRDVDPFGRKKDYIMLEGTSVSFSQNRALEIAVAGVYQWDCPECETTNFTTANKNVPCKSCKAAVDAQNLAAAARERSPRAKLQSYTFYDMPKAKLITFDAEVLTAVFALATNISTYVSLQARDVKDDAEPRGKKR